MLIKLTELKILKLLICPLILRSCVFFPGWQFLEAFSLHFPGKVVNSQKVLLGKDENTKIASHLVFKLSTHLLKLLKARERRFLAVSKGPLL